MRRLGIVILLLLTVATATAGELTFVAPLEGSQVYGAGLLEVVSDRADIDRVDFFVDGTIVGVARTAPFRVAYDFGDSPARHEVIARAHAGGFQRQIETRITTAALSIDDAVAIDLVEVPITIASRNRAVDKAEFSVRENGVPQRVVDLVRDRPPTDFVFIVDRSLSMRGNRLAHALAAARTAAARLREGDTASLLTFNHRIAEGDLRSEALPAASGGTALRDALMRVRPARSTAVILVCDATDRDSLVDEGTALRHIARANVSLHVVALGDGNATSFLKKAAAQSGGTFRRSDDARAALDQLLDLINSRHTLVYQSSHHDSGWRTIDVAAPRGTPLKVAKPGYFAQ